LLAAYFETKYVSTPLLNLRLNTPGQFTRLSHETGKSMRPHMAGLYILDTDVILPYGLGTPTPSRVVLMLNSKFRQSFSEAGKLLANVGAKSSTCLGLADKSP